MATVVTAWRWACSPIAGGTLLACCFVAGPKMLLAQTSSIAAPAAGLVESGAPPFAVTGPEGLGLASVPRELRRLPDGRLLAVGGAELALGDGVRWEVFRAAEEVGAIDVRSVAVDADGAIYAPTPSGFGQIVFDAFGHWRLHEVVRLPDEMPQGAGGITRVGMLKNEWLWSAASGPIVSWRPGVEARVVGQANAVEAYFELNGAVHYSDGSNGGLFRLLDDTFQPVPLPASAFVQDTVTAAVPIGDDHWLAGTIGRGVVQILPDGRMAPLVARGVLSGEHRINDLSLVTSRYVAAAVDNVGVVFFDTHGRIVQVLDRSVDHRLARVRSLLVTPGGVVWALLNDGVARIRFPARVSSFEPLVPTGLAFAQPVRRDGRLWLMSDGRAQRGIYDDDGRLVRFEIDSPPGYVGSLAEVGGHWLASTTAGMWLWRGEHAWERVVEGVNTPSVRPEPVEPGRWLYIADGEVGWLRIENGRIWAERFPVEGLGHVYGAVADGTGVFWAELGVARVARVEPSQPRPYVEVYGPDDGLAQGWAQLSVIDGSVHVSAQPAVLGFDARTRRWSPDTELMQRLPGLQGVVGRPTIDARDRLWVPVDGGTRVGPRDAMGGFDRSIPSDLRPVHVTPQADGVVWLHQPMRLARYDPSLPEAARPALRTLITRVQFAKSGRTVLAPAASLPDVAADDNSLSIHFAAPDTIPGQPVTFAVKLEGPTSTEWIPAGGSGAFTLSRLDAGRYRVRVQPNAGGEAGEEATMEFAVLAPWFKTPLAYGSYAAAALLLLGTIGWLPVWLERREKARLEKLVVERTAALNRANEELAGQVQETLAQSAALQRSEDRYRRLTENAPDIIFRLRVMPDVAFEYISRAVVQIAGYEPEEFYRDPHVMTRLAPSGTQPGLLDIAASGRISERAREVQGVSKQGRAVVLEERLVPVHDESGRLVAVEGMLRDVTHERDEESRRRRLESELFQAQKLESIGTLAGGIAHDFNNILTGILGCCELATLAARDGQPVDAELAEIRAAGLRAKDLIARILTFSRRTEPRFAIVDLAEAVSEALKLLRATTPATIHIEAKLQSGRVRADATQIHQVVVNLCTNAVHAMRTAAGQLDLTVEPVEIAGELARSMPELPPGAAMRLTISDTGHGMDAATLARIFDPFFTTKAPGEGTGLGLSIVRGIVDNHGGALRVHSELGRGTRIDVYFPATSQASPAVTGEGGKSGPRGAQREIMVVDDEPAVAKFMAARLRQLDFRAQVFLEPLGARDAFVREPSRFAAIITDLTMPQISGVELIKSVRRVAPEVPVVVVSGFNVDMAGLAQGALPRVAVLAKPFTGDDLGAALGQVLGDAPPAN